MNIFVAFDVIRHLSVLGYEYSVLVLAESLKGETSCRHMLEFSLFVVHKPSNIRH